MKLLLDILSTRKGSKFRRNFVLVFRANVFAQLLAVACMPILSRLYSSDDFGLFAVFVSLATIASSVATGRFEWLIPNSSAALSASALMVLSLSVVLLSSFLLFAVGLIFTVSDVQWGLSGLGRLVLLIPVIVIGTALAEIFTGWFIHRSDLRAVSRAKVAQTSVNSGAGLLGGALGLGSQGLISAFLVAQWVGVTMLARHAKPFWRSLRRLSARRVMATYYRHRREAAWSTLVSVVNAGTMSGMVFVLAMFFSMKEVGWYTLMMRVASGPITMLSSAIGQSFWSAAAEHARAGRFEELRRLHFRTTRRLALLAVPILLGCGVAPFVVGPLFGNDEWAGAGTVLLAMAPMLVGAAVFSPTNHLVVYNRQAYQLFSDFLAIILSILALYICSSLGLGFSLSVFMMSSAVLISYLLRFKLHLVANTEAARARAA